jgi:hypothetical protein
MIFTPPVTVRPRIRGSAGLTTNLGSGCRTQPRRNAELPPSSVTRRPPIVFDDVVRDTGLSIFPFRAPGEVPCVRARADGTDRQLDIVSSTRTPNQTLIAQAKRSRSSRTTHRRRRRATSRGRWHSTRLGTVPHLGDTYELKLLRPVQLTDMFTFTTTAQRVDNSLAKEAGSSRTSCPIRTSAPRASSRSASRSPAAAIVVWSSARSRREVSSASTRCAVISCKRSGRTARRRAWSLGTCARKDNLDVAPGLYLFHVDAPGVGTTVGKFAIIK